MNEEWITIERSKHINTDEPKDIIYSWIYSPSGMYAVDLDYKEILQHDDEPETHCYLIRFFVLDVLKKFWCPYTVCTGPFKRFYSYYWLGDHSAVLLDFTKRDSSVRQNVLYFDHKNKIVTCNVIRNFEFDVDMMCYSRDFNAQKFIHSKGEFLLLCGYKSPENGLVCRMVPYYPYMTIPLSIDEFFINTQHILQSLTSDDTISAGGHPFVFGTTLIFLLYRRNDSGILHFINYTMQVDIGAALDGGERDISAKHGRIHTFMLSSRPHWLPTFKTIPNLYNTDEFVLLWEERRQNSHNRSRRKTKLFILDLKANAMRVFRTTLLRNDFACVHPNGSLHIFIQTKLGMKLELNTLSFRLYSLENLCQQEILRSTSNESSSSILISFLGLGYRLRKN